MTVIDDLPATDAMNVAALLGVDLADLAAVHDRDPVAHESAPRIAVADPALRCRTSHKDPVELLDEFPRARLVVPVVPTRRRRGPAFCTTPATEVLLERCGLQGLRIDPYRETAGICWWHTAPASHDGHRSRRRCDLSDDAGCWRACAAAVIDHAGDLFAGDIYLGGPRTPNPWYIAAPLLGHPPAGVTRSEIDEVSRQLAALTGDLVMFTPHPVSGYEGP